MALPSQCRYTRRKENQTPDGIFNEATASHPGEQLVPPILLADVGVNRMRFYRAPCFFFPSRSLKLPTDSMLCSAPTLCIAE